jgi:hypothetical protein
MHKGLQGRYRVPDTVRDIINLIIWVVFGVIGGKAADELFKGDYDLGLGSILTGAIGGIVVT